MIWDIGQATRSWTMPIRILTPIEVLDSSHQIKMSKKPRPKWFCLDWLVEICCVVWQGQFLINIIYFNTSLSQGSPVKIKHKYFNSDTSSPKFECNSNLKKWPGHAPDELCLGAILTSFFPITKKEFRNSSQWLNIKS